MIVVPARIGPLDLPRWRRLKADDGTEAHLTGIAFTNSVAESRALRDALAALPSNVDEPVVPIVDPSGFTGFYRVTAVEATAAPAWVDVNLTAERVVGHREPLVESVLVGALRANDHSIVASRPFHAVPGPTQAWSWQPAAASGDTEELALACEGGQVRRRRVLNAPSGIARWSCRPDGWYQGAASVETEVAGRLMPVVGRQSLAHPEPWWAGNGLTRATVTPGHRVAIQWWRPEVGQWSATREFAVRGYSVSAIEFTAAQVVRAAPHFVTVRCSGRMTLGPRGTVDMWLTIRRGGVGVELTFRSSTGTPFILRPFPSVAGTTAGSHMTGPVGADGVGWMIAAADSGTHVASESRVESESLTGTSWAAGIVGCQPAVAGWSAAETLGAYWAVQSERVVAGVA